jgi:hypothetical protein
MRILGSLGNIVAAAAAAAAGVVEFKDFVN